MSKRKKRLAAAAVLTTGLVVLVGLGSASATRLCDKVGVGEKCTATVLKTGTAFEAVLKAGTKSVLPIGFATIECTQSTLKGKTTGEGGGLGVAVTAKVEEATWGTCNKCGAKEAVMKKQAAWGAEVAGTGNKDGEFIHEVSVLTECEGETCFYRKTTNISPLKGGVPALLEITSSLVLEGGSGAKCKPGKWTATYEFKTPTELFVTKE